MFKFYYKTLALCLLSLVFTGCSDSPSTDLDASCKARLNPKYLKKQGLYDRLYKGSLFSPGPTISNEKTCRAPWKQGEVVARGMLYGEAVEQVFLGIYVGGSQSDYVFKNFYTKTQQAASGLFFSRGATYHNNSDFSDTAHLGINNSIRLIDPQGINRIEYNYVFGNLVWQRTWHANGNKKNMVFMGKEGMEGEYQVWHENEVLAVKGYYYKNKPTALWQYWDTQGVLTREHNYNYTQDYTQRTEEIKQGLTWVVTSTKDAIVNIGCGGALLSCDAYITERSCTEQRPLLCIQRTPVLASEKAATSPKHYVAATQPIEGQALKTLAAANALCQENFGAEWQVAEFNDSPNLNGAFSAYKDKFNRGQSLNKGTQLWLDNNQIEGNCWGKKVEDAKAGLTWAARAFFGDNVYVSCDHGFCNPYKGDTLCTQARPLLCINHSQLPPPDYAGYDLKEWSESEVATTEPIRGDALESLAVATKFCQSRFGAEWQVASVQDSPQKNTLFLAKANNSFVKNTRLWLDNNRLNGNCWEKESEDLKTGITWTARYAWFTGDERIIDIHCAGSQGSCDADRIATACTEQRPLLCIQKTGLPAPSVSPYFQEKWTGGRVSATAPITGNTLETLDAANKYCQSSFGADWQVAGVDDAPKAGPLFFAYENGFISQETGFWLNTKQKKGTCWAQ